jgi:hypothetical protein
LHTGYERLSGDVEVIAHPDVQGVVCGLSRQHAGWSMTHRIASSIFLLVDRRTLVR